MKKTTLLKFYVVITMLLFDFAVFAQDTLPADEGDGGLESGDAPPAPIDGKLIWLALAGILFATYVYKSYNQKEKA